MEKKAYKVSRIEEDQERREGALGGNVRRIAIVGAAGVALMAGFSSPAFAEGNSSNDEDRDERDALSLSNESATDVQESNDQSKGNSRAEEKSDNKDSQPESENRDLLGDTEEDELREGLIGIITLESAQTSMSNDDTGNETEPEISAEDEAKPESEDADTEEVTEFYDKAKDKKNADQNQNRDAGKKEDNADSEQAEDLGTSKADESEKVGKTEANTPEQTKPEDSKKTETENPKGETKEPEQAPDTEKAPEVDKKAETPEETRSSDEDNADSSEKEPEAEDDTDDKTASEDEGSLLDSVSVEDIVTGSDAPDPAEEAPAETKSEEGGDDKEDDRHDTIVAPSEESVVGDEPEESEPTEEEQPSILDAFSAADISSAATSTEEVPEQPAEGIFAEPETKTETETSEETKAEPETETETPKETEPKSEPSEEADEDSGSLLDSLEGADIVEAKTSPEGEEEPSEEGEGSDEEAPAEAKAPEEEKGEGEIDEDADLIDIIGGIIAGESENESEAADEGESEEEPAPAPEEPEAEPEPAPEPEPELKKSNAEIAQEVIDNKWGVDEDRQKRLEDAGYDYDAVQAEVNKLVQERDRKRIEEGGGNPLDLPVATGNAPTYNNMDRPIQSDLKNRYGGVSGKLNESELATVQAPHRSNGMNTWKLQKDAAEAFEAMNTEFKARTGHSICIAQTYRSYEGQVAAKQRHGRGAAQPGKSNHGWGLAADLCDPNNPNGAVSRNSEFYKVLEEIGPKYGWVNPHRYDPRFAEFNNTAKKIDEPWHFEYVEKVYPDYYKR